MNYCEEEELHVIKLMDKVYLREIRMSLLLVCVPMLKKFEILLLPQI